MTNKVILPIFLSLISLFLGYFLAPLGDKWKSWVKTPEVQVEFAMNVPYFVRQRIYHSDMIEQKDKAYYQACMVRFGIKNESETATAEGCRVYITGIRHKKEDGKFHDETSFQPFPVETLPRASIFGLDISPKMEVFGYIGRVADTDFQMKYDVEGYPGGNDKPQFRFSYISTGTWTNPQLDPGVHEITATLYFRNRKPIVSKFEIDWSGSSSEDMRLMQKELKVVKK